LAIGPNRARGSQGKGLAPNSTLYQLSYAVREKIEARFKSKARGKKSVRAKSELGNTLAKARQVSKLVYPDNPNSAARAKRKGKENGGWI